MKPEERIIVDLDEARDLIHVEELTAILAPLAGAFRVGPSLHHRLGNIVFAKIRVRQRVPFFDGRWLHTPQEVYKLAAQYSSAGAKMLSVQCLGGEGMMNAAVNATCDKTPNGEEKAEVFGVTLPHHFTYDDLVSLGIAKTTNIHYDQERKETQEKAWENISIKRLAWLAQECILNGVMIPAWEVEWARSYLQPEFKIIAFNVRPSWEKEYVREQHLTPQETMKRGADYIVIGSPVVKAKNPPQALSRVLEEIS